MQTGWYKLPVTTENTAASDNTQAEDSAETATASQATAADQEDNSVSLPAISGYKYYDEDGKRASGWRTIEGVENISEDGEYFRFYFKNGAPYYGKRTWRSSPLTPKNMPSTQQVKCRPASSPSGSLTVQLPITTLTKKVL